MATSLLYAPGDAERKRKLAEMLMASSMTPPAIQKGDPPAKSWLPLIQALGGMKQRKEADRLDAERNKEIQATLQGAMSPTPLEGPAQPGQPGPSRPKTIDELAQALSGSKYTQEAGLNLQMQAMLGRQKAQMPGSTPAGVLEWNEYQKTTPEKQKQWLEFKRGVNVMDLGGEKAVRSPGGGIGERYQVTPKPEDMPAFKGAQAEAQAEAKAGVERSSEAIKKSMKAGSMTDLIGQADALLDDATGSMVGAAVAKGKGALGVSDKTTQANQQLKLLSGWLVSNVPRMEGPQSEFDVKNYQEMAGVVGDMTVPVKDRRAALGQLLRLQSKYKAVDTAPSTPPNGGLSPQEQSELDQLRKQLGR